MNLPATLPMTESSSHSSRTARRAATFAVLALTAGASWAHPGHSDHGLSAGLLHPLTGIDHLLATSGLGLLAGYLAGTRGQDAGPHGRVSGAVLWAMGIAAAAGLLLGALLGSVLGGRNDSGIEVAAAVSLLVIAVLLFRVERLAARPVEMVAVLVGIPHGYLHATEGAGGAFFVGLALASALLFAAGIVCGRLLDRLPGASRSLGRSLVAAGFAVCSVGLLSLSF
jgi:urease accessory protein